MNKPTLSLLASISPNGTLAATIIFAVMFAVATAVAIYLALKLKKTVAKHNEDVKALEATLQEREVNIIALNADLNKALIECNNLQQRVVNLTADLEKSQQEVEKQQNELQELNAKIFELQSRFDEAIQQGTNLKMALTESQVKTGQQEDELKTLNERLADMQNCLDEVSQQAELLQATAGKPIRQPEKNESKDEGQIEPDKQDPQQKKKGTTYTASIDKDKMINVRKFIRKILSENEQLRQREDERNRGYTIEDYFPAIDAAFEYADSCKFDQENPRGSFATQRQQLNEIRRCLDAYRSQRR